MFVATATRTMAGATPKFREPEPPFRSMDEIRAEKIAEQRRGQAEESARRVEEHALAITSAFHAIHACVPNTIRSVIERVAKEEGVSYAEIVGPRRTRNIVRVRFRAVREAADAFPNKTIVQIGRAFNRDHTTILSALKGGRSALYRKQGA